MIDINQENLKSGLLGLVIAIVEIIKDALKMQATRRVDSGRLSEEETERLGAALADLEEAIEKMKEEQGVSQAVQSVRAGLDDIANEMINKFIDPREWEKQIK